MALVPKHAVYRREANTGPMLAALSPSVRLPGTASMLENSLRWNDVLENVGKVLSGRKDLP